MEEKIKTFFRISAVHQWSKEWLSICDPNAKIVFAGLDKELPMDSAMKLEEEFASFPDFHFEIKSITKKGDNVYDVVECPSGTFSGKPFAPFGLPPVSPTGKVVSITETGTFFFNSEGKIVKVLCGGGPLVFYKEAGGHSDAWSKVLELKANEEQSKIEHIIRAYFRTLVAKGSKDAFLALCDPKAKIAFKEKELLMKDLYDLKQNVGLVSFPDLHHTIKSITKVGENKYEVLESPWGTFKGKPFALVGLPILEPTKKVITFTEFDTFWFNPEGKILKVECSGGPLAFYKQAGGKIPEEIEASEVPPLIDEAIRAYFSTIVDKSAKEEFLSLCDSNAKIVFKDKEVHMDVVFDMKHNVGMASFPDFHFTVKSITKKAPNVYEVLESASGTFLGKPFAPLGLPPLAPTGKVVSISEIEIFWFNADGKIERVESDGGPLAFYKAAGGKVDASVEDRIPHERVIPSGSIKVDPATRNL
jgi:predicted ester cyclase